MDPNWFPAMAGVGMLALIPWIVLAFVGFVISAFIMSLFVRLVICFMRKSLERECRYMRGGHTDFGTKRAPNTVPRNW